MGQVSRGIHRSRYHAAVAAKLALQASHKAARAAAVMLHHAIGDHAVTEDI
jgi:hypothetical protein